MKNYMIGFVYQPNVAMLKWPFLDLEWKAHIKQNDEIFQLLEKAIGLCGGFDYYVLDDILIIPDFRSKNNLFKFELNGVHFQTYGEFIIFFRISERKAGVIIADSLTLRQYYFIKNNLRRVDGELLSI